MAGAVTAGDGIVVAGYANNGTNDDLAVVRYNADGSLDTSFGIADALGGTVSYTEGAAAIVLDDSVDVHDAELDALNGGLGNYSGASLTLVRNGGVSTEDVFAFNDGNGITFSGGTLIKNAQVIATFDTTTTTGELVINFTDANGEIPNSTDVDNILQQITYANSSDTPPASVQIDWTFDDGNTGAQGTGGALTATGSTTVNITAVNDDPTNAGSLPTDLVFLQDTQGKLDLSQIDLSDVDAGLSDLTLTITSDNGHLQTMGWPGLTLGGSQNVLILTGNLTDLNDFLNDVNSIDYEHGTPGISGNNVDLITIEITDNGNTGSGGGGTIELGTVNIDITGTNADPEITSDGGGATASINVAENVTAVTTVTATDADGDQIEYTITGGADAALFDIDRNTGTLTFINAPDFESPGDANGDNVYEVVVSADDQISTPDTQTINVTVTNINEGPDQYKQINENTLMAANMDAGDQDAPPYGIVGGADAALFQVSHNPVSRTFYLMFSAPPNFESPSDSNLDNVYEVTVNFNSVIYNYFVTVKDANDAAAGLPTISGATTEDQTLSVDASGISDEDGLGIFSYQWLRDGSTIIGATAGTYTLDDADVGTQISVQVGYTDGRGTNETVTSTQTAAITGVNDAPVLTNGNALSLTTITEDAVNNSGDLISTILASSGGDPITDADSGAVEGIAITGLNNSNGAWEYNVGSGWTAVGNVSVTESLLLRSTDSLRFVPDGLNADTASITFAAWDQTSGAAGTKVDTSVFGGTTAFSEVIEAAVITVTAVNDAPTAAGSTVVTNENFAYTFTLADFNFGDVDGDSLTQIRITSLESVGSLELSGGPVALNQVITAADITAGNLKYWPIANTDGAPYDSFSFEVHDGTEYSAGSYSMTVNVTNVNVSPTTTDDTYTVNEDGTLTVDWWDTDWTHRQKLSFDNLAQTETLTDFPVLIVLNSSNIDYTQTKDDGSDLRFFAADGTPLAYEIEQWNEGGDSSVWVRVPQITGNSNSDSILMYYGNDAAESGEACRGSVGQQLCRCVASERRAGRYRRNWCLQGLNILWQQRHRPGCCHRSGGPGHRRSGIRSQRLDRDRARREP